MLRSIVHHVGSYKTWKSITPQLSKPFMLKSLTSQPKILRSYTVDVGRQASESLSINSSHSKEKKKDGVKLNRRSNLRRLSEFENKDKESSLSEEYKRNFCKAYCTSEEYDFKVLLEELKKQFKCTPLLPEVYKVDLGLGNGEVFLFQAGTFVYWGPDANQAETFLTSFIKSNSKVEKGKYEEYETEQFLFVQDKQLATYLDGDLLVVGGENETDLIKLAYSHGLARSAKLSILEDLLDTLLASMAHYPILLSNNQAHQFQRKEILHKLGQVFLLRGILNLQSESFLDTPDYYWSKPSLERCYENISKNLDVRPRISILNKKLDYANELTHILREQLAENHSTKLEWCIIILIAVEVLFESLHYWDRYNSEKSQMKKG